MAKIIFLDVDGVLNRCEGMWVKTLPQVHQRLPLVTEANIVSVLNHLVSQRDEIRIVVSSTWRKICADYLEFEEKTGVDHRLIHEDWRTGNFGDRADQVREWLYRHPEVTQYVVVDDNVYNFKDYPEIPLIQTHERYGITYEDFVDIFRELGYNIKDGYYLKRRPIRYGKNMGNC